jgi:hypothetical protein
VERKFFQPKYSSIIFCFKLVPNVLYCSKVVSYHMHILAKLRFGTVHLNKLLGHNVLPPKDI